MLETLKEFNIKYKSVSNEKILAIMEAYTEDENRLNIKVKMDKNIYNQYKTEINTDWKYFCYIVFRKIVDADIHIEYFHSETPEWFNADVGVNICIKP